MIELKLRDEFKGKRLKGTTVDFTNQSQTGALQQQAGDFLRITYPSHDLLKTIEATGPGQSRPLAMIGSRGQGKRTVHQRHLVTSIAIAGAIA